MLMAEIVDPRQLSLVELRALARQAAERRRRRVVRAPAGPGSARSGAGREAASHRRRSRELVRRAAVDPVDTPHRRRRRGRRVRPTTSAAIRSPSSSTRLLDRAGDNDLSSLSAEELVSYGDALHEFEQARSHERRELFTRIDELSAELVRRYRDGEANVDGLLAADD